MKFRIATEKLLWSIFILLAGISFTLIPLKILRTELLWSQHVRYYPTQNKKPTGPRLELNVAIKVLEAERSASAADPVKYLATFDQAEHQHRISEFGKLSELKSNPLLTFVDYWPQSPTWIVTKGILDRVDDFSFWNTLGATIITYLLYRCSWRLRRCYRDSYLRSVELSTLQLFLVGAISACWIGFMLFDHATSEHGPFHGGPWTTSFVGGMRELQTIDTALFCAVAFLTSFVLVAAYNFLGVFLAREARPRFNEPIWLLAWESLLNVGYLPVIFTLVAIPVVNFFQHFTIPLNEMRMIPLFFVYHLPFFVLTGIGFSRTRRFVRYTILEAAKYVVWLSTNKSKDAKSVD